LGEKEKKGWPPQPLSGKIDRAIKIYVRPSVEREKERRHESPREFQRNKKKDESIFIMAGNRSFSRKKNENNKKKNLMKFLFEQFIPFIFFSLQPQVIFFWVK
jgi:hypothetical protein